MKRNWIAHLVLTFTVLALSFNAFADEVEEFSFRNGVKFWMTKSEVLQVETETNQTDKTYWYPLTPEKWEWLWYDEYVTVSDYSACLMYSFAAGTLQGANYLFGFYDKETFDGIASALSELYGEKADVSNDELDEFARPVIGGIIGPDVELSNGYVWYQDNVTIYEYQYGENGKFAITYLNPEFDYELFNNGAAAATTGL